MVPELSIIILNWNSVRFLERCLESIEEQTREISYEVIIVDGASYDGSEQLIREKFPWASFHQLSSNVGFARANNLGARHARASTLLFLNPDTLILDSAVEKLYRAFHSVSNIGAAGLILLNSDRSIQTSAVQRFPGIANQVFDFDPLLNRFKTFPLWGKKALYGTVPAQVEVVSGACLMIDRALFEKVGGFNEGYFMYGEDSRLCWDVRKAGKTVCLLPVGHVVHYGGGSTRNQRVSAFSARTFRHSMYLFVKQTRGGAYAELFRFAIAACALARLAVLYPLSLIKGTAVRRSIEKWRHVLGWACAGVPLES